jgi:hypothetical protein
MTVKQIFDLGVQMGIKSDSRGVKGVKEYLERVKKGYEGMKPKDKKFFDKERLEHPYSDSRIYVDDKKTQVKRILAGIDMKESEIILASQLTERGKKIDLALAHHPVGKGLANLHETMDMLVDIFEQQGVPVHVAEKIMEERIKEVGRSVHPVNHYKVIDIAELLKVNLINTHTVTDNLVTQFLTKEIEKKKPRTLGDLVDMLLEIPEYAEAKMRGAGPMITSGSPEHRLGKFLVEMTGGTNPSGKVYKELSQYGISTIVGMHMAEPHREEANKSYMNIIICGHIASDSLGMNLFLDELEKKGIEIIPCGGLIRVSRVKEKAKK